jgi:restriction system protein
MVERRPIQKDVVRELRGAGGNGPLQLEEMIAGAYDLAGFPSVTITPRSGDRGRDVIATSRDGYTVRILDHAKKYAPNNIVGYDAIRAFIMVLDADRATRGFLATTGVFPPDLLEDHLIAPRLGSTLELVDGSNLTKRLGELASGGGTLILLDNDRSAP